MHPDLLTRAFPYLAAVLAAVAVTDPDLFLPWREAVVPLLGVVMLGMGLTLSAESFAAVARRPALVALGVGLQFLVMPLAGWLLALLFGLPPQLVAGVVLVGAAPGGTASNVITYLARGDVALSVTLKASSTLLSVVLTPALTWLYVGRTVPVPTAEMLLGVVQVVLAPVALGVLLNRWLGRRLDTVRAVFPAFSVSAICLIIAIVVATNREEIGQLAAAAVAVVVLHNLVGLAAGYWATRWLGYGEAQCRTLAIEVGMQNSGLAATLAMKYFTAAAALPGAVFSVWHNLSGASLAAHWVRRDRARGLTAEKTPVG